MRRDFSVIHSPESAAPNAKKIILPFHDLTQTAQEIVREIHTRLVEEGIFVPRKDEEAMWNNHHVIIDPSDIDSPLGGASVIDDPSQTWKELTRIWTQEHLRGNGVASTIIQHWMRRWKNEIIFALTTQPDAHKTLIKNNFSNMGTVSGLKNSILREYLPDRVQKYPEGRDPWMLARFSEK